jgi:hypothetical protein
MKLLLVPKIPFQYDGKSIPAFRYHFKITEGMLKAGHNGGLNNPYGIRQTSIPWKGKLSTPQVIKYFPASSFIKNKEVFANPFLGIRAGYKNIVNKTRRDSRNYVSTYEEMFLKLTGGFNPPDDFRPFADHVINVNSSTFRKWLILYTQFETDRDFYKYNEFLFDVAFEKLYGATTVNNMSINRSAERESLFKKSFPLLRGNETGLLAELTEDMSLAQIRLLIDKWKKRPAFSYQELR